MFSFANDLHRKLNVCALYVVIHHFLFVFLLNEVQSTNGLSSGPGKYEFNNSDTGELVKVYYYKPKAFNANTPVAMILHGQMRNAKKYRDDWQKLVEMRKPLLVLVPLFSNKTYRDTNGYNLGNVFATFNEAEVNGYESSGVENPVEKWSFSLPDRVFAEFKKRETTDQSGYTMYGHGAGAQFATRFALLLPDSQACHVIAANPGWFTYPDRSVAWPYGLRRANCVSDAQIDRFLRNPLTLMLGDNDTKTSGVIRETEEARAQGKNRKERGERFFNFTQTLAHEHHVKSAWQLIYVPHAGHSDAKMSLAAIGHFHACT